MSSPPGDEQTEDEEQYPSLALKSSLLQRQATLPTKVVGGFQVPSPQLRSVTRTGTASTPLDPVHTFSSRVVSQEDEEADTLYTLSAPPSRSNQQPSSLHRSSSDLFDLGTPLDMESIRSLSPRHQNEMLWQTLESMKNHLSDVRQRAALFRNENKYLRHMNECLELQVAKEGDEQFALFNEELRNRLVHVESEAALEIAELDRKFAKASEEIARLSALLEDSETRLKYKDEALKHLRSQHQGLLLDLRDECDEKQRLINSLNQSRSSEPFDLSRPEVVRKSRDTGSVASRGRLRKRKSRNSRSCEFCMCTIL